MTQPQVVIKVGIIGPRAHTLGGHDFNNVIRDNLRDQIKALLQAELDKGITLHGFTGLGLGAEQDFALACLDLAVDYSCYLAHENMSDRWNDLPKGQVDIYNDLLEASINKVLIGDGNYSPKKILAKDKRIIKDTDLIIFVENPHRKGTNKLVTFCKKLSKRVIILKVLGTDCLS